MKRFCESCRVSVSSAGENCPLCRSPLAGVANLIADYPYFCTEERIKEPYTLLTKIFLLVSVLVVFVCVAINVFVWNGTVWAVTVLLGVIACWLCIGLPLMSRLNVNQMLIFQLIGVSGFLWNLDYVTGNNQWAMNYVYPLLFVMITFTMGLLAIIFRIFWRDYLYPLAVMALMGIVSLLLIPMGMITIYWPLSGVIATSALLILGLMLFAGEKTAREIGKRLHTK